MNIKRIFLAAIGLSILILLIISWFEYTEGGPLPYPINTGSFLTIGSARIDPSTLLEDVRNGKEPILRQIESGFPEDSPFVMPVGWSQNEYLDIAQALHKVIWKDNPGEWHLYRMSFYVGCENLSGKFENADLYYYQEVKVNGRRMYSVRNLLIEPEFGYVAWGEDSKFPRPMWGWAEIEIENILSIPAEKALELADQQSGHEFRDKEKNECRITVDMWPWGFDRSDWRINYSGNIDLAKIEIWIPSK